MNIINSSILMKSEPSEKSTLESECLFGETVQILAEHLNWVNCKLITDQYVGWVQKKGLGETQEATHRVLAKMSFIYIYPNEKSNCVFYLPMGSRLTVKDIKNDWAEVSLVSNKIKIGYVPSQHIVKLDHKVEDWVSIAQLFEGTPYRWGGRDSIGLDCSALLQLSYQTSGEIIPRNTSEQVNLEKPDVTIISKLKRGCVIFWKGHVGIMIDKFNCIHANAFHMKTITEPLFDIIKRMDKDNQIVRMMDFN